MLFFKFAILIDEKKVYVWINKNLQFQDGLQIGQRLL